MQVLPLTINGKLDRNALPKPDAIIESQSHIAPRTETEQQLAQIWGELLGLENIGVHDNFFALGGHSLLATRIASRIKKVFDTELPLQALFQAVTISELAICIEASQKQADDSVDNCIQAIPRRTSIQDFDKV
jgi:acyl carrier protein